MEVAWDAAPISSPELVRLCGQRLGWKKSTTYTILKKLCEKGLLANENAAVSVLVSKACVTASEAEGFVDRTFGGSLPGFLTAFMAGKKISREEAESLKRMIDEHQEE
jgi:predicted transcriptional regulator